MSHELKMARNLEKSKVLVIFLCVKVSVCEWLYLSAFVRKKLYFVRNLSAECPQGLKMIENKDCTKKSTIQPPFTLKEHPRLLNEHLPFLQ